MAKLTRVISRDGSIRAFVTDAADIVNRAIQIHNTTPTATAALGRVLIGASMMGSLMAEDNDLLTLKIAGDGIGGTIVVSSDSFGNVRGFIQNPEAELPLRADGKLNVGGIVGKGNLFVMRDTGGKEPYVGICPLQSGEIAEDIAKYYAESEQVPTVCALGVLVDRDYSCKAAGGALIQLLPFADPEVVDILEKNVIRATSVTDMLQKGGIDLVLSTFLEGIEYDIFDNLETEYRCNCSKERTDRALLSLNRETRAELLQDEKLEMNCQFCDRKYIYTRDELEKLYEQPKND